MVPNVHDAMHAETGNPGGRADKAEIPDMGFAGLGLMFGDEGDPPQLPEPLDATPRRGKRAQRFQEPAPAGSEGSLPAMGFGGFEYMYADAAGEELIVEDAFVTPQRPGRAERGTRPAAPQGPRVYNRRPKTSRNKKTMRANELRHEKRLVELAKSSGDDAAIARCLRTRAGRKAYPALASAASPGQEEAAFVRNASALVGKAGRHSKASLVRELTKGLPTKWVKNNLDTDEAYVKHARSKATVSKETTPRTDRMGRSTPAQTVTEQQYPQNVQRLALGEEEEAMLVTFFVDTTHILSGAERNTRNLEQQEWEWAVELYELYPTYLRRVAQQYPHLLKASEKRGGKRVLTKFQAEMRAATWQSEQAGYKGEIELSKRKEAATKKYLTKLGRKAGRIPEETDAEALERKQKTREQANLRWLENWDPSAYVVRGVSYETFQGVLERHKLRFTRFSSPHNCPLCESGPLDRVVLALKEKQAVKLMSENPERALPAKLVAELRNLRKKDKAYSLHVQQLEAARKATQDYVKCMEPGVCAVVRDYVNHHDHGGSHVKCLHWVMMWREEANGELLLMKVRNYCSDKDSCSTDSYFTADVAEFHLGKKGPHNPGYFDNFHTVVFMGDHGPHFSSGQCVHHESTLKRKFNKNIRLMFYTSYHAFGRADGAGAEDKRHAIRDLRKGIPRLGARSYTDMTNESNDPLSRAHEFVKINRSEDVFPKEHEIVSGVHIRKWCEVTFPAEGIACYRLVTGKGPWKYVALRPGWVKEGDGEPLCESCSTAESKLVHHAKVHCPKPTKLSMLHALPEYRDIGPDPARIQGEQRSRKKQGADRCQKKKPVFPCKFDGCAHFTNARKAFRTASTANKHMTEQHAAAVGDGRLTLYPESDPSSATAAQPGGDDEEGKHGEDEERKHGEDEEEPEKNEDTAEDDDDAPYKVREGEKDVAAWEVEEIIGRRTHKRQLQYRVRWKGCTSSDDSWEPESSLTNAPECIRQYNRTNPPPKKRRKKRH